MICALCQRPGAGLRYQGPGAAWWFHARCWRITRAFASGETAADIADYLQSKAKGGSVGIGPTARVSGAPPALTIRPQEGQTMAIPHVTTASPGRGR